LLFSVIIGQLNRESPGTTNSPGTLHSTPIFLRSLEKGDYDGQSYGSYDSRCKTGCTLV
jgi:hypothetical protein